MEFPLLRFVLARILSFRTSDFSCAPNAFLLQTDTQELEPLTVYPAIPRWVLSGWSDNPFAVTTLACGPALIALLPDYDTTPRCHRRTESSPTQPHAFLRQAREVNIGKQGTYHSPCGLPAVGVQRFMSSMMSCLRNCPTNASTRPSAIRLPTFASRAACGIVSK